MRELELKFQAAPTHSEALEAAWRDRLSRRVHLVAHGYDTADGCLARHALALRVFKKGGAPWAQCLEAPGRDGRPGVAHEVPFAGGRAHAPPPVDVGLHEHSDAGRALRAALDEDGYTASDLLLVHTTDLWRRTARLQVDGSTIELMLEAGTV
jgi:triphosphatase